MTLPIVIAGLVPATHLASGTMGRRNKSGDDKWYGLEALDCDDASLLEAAQIKETLTRWTINP